MPLALPTFGSVIEVLAGYAVEAENVVGSKDAAWGLKARFDVSGGDASRGVKGTGGGQRPSFRHPHARACHLALIVARHAD